ncbi:MAG: hypothetical protein ACK519_07515 [Sphingomonadaceae bacterium]|jgi:hypothetical protein
MNLGTAIETMRYAIALDKRLGVTESLQGAVSALANLASNPADSSFQVGVRAALDKLANRLRVVEEELSAADALRLEELGASNLFPGNLFEHITELFNANVATPSVAHTHVQQIMGERDSKLNGFKSVIDVAEGQKWEIETDGEGEAEVGFTIPRAIFDNKLKGFTKELEWINRFISTVTESSTGQHEEFQVSRLSTTDPTVFILTTYAAAMTFGKLVTWALDTWKSVEEIRHLRAQSSALTAFKVEEVESFFGDKIRQQVKEEIEKAANALVTNVANAGRKNELQTSLSMRLEQFLQRVERGMTVEIRLIGQQEANDETLVDDDAATAQTEFSELAAGLIFPKPSTEPVLQLTGGASGEQAKPSHVGRQTG